MKELLFGKGCEIVPAPVAGNLFFFSPGKKGITSGAWKYSKIWTASFLKLFDREEVVAYRY